MNTNDNIDHKNTHQSNGKPYVVGVGASAGGLEALQSLLSALPTNLGFPYIVIQHLSPDYKSLLSEILSKYTQMPVLQADDNMPIQPDCIYVIPPGKSLTLSKGHLCLADQIPKALHLPIDTFFSSLAEEADSNAIAIILSGTGSDGTNGIKSIKEHNGMVMVQSPENAKFDGMPRSALRTGLVDMQGAPEEIAAEIKNIASVANKGSIPVAIDKEIDSALMERIYYILKRISNINFAHYKKATILRRIERRMLLCRKDALSDYVDYLYENPSEAKTLSKEVLIGVTSFFREPEYFAILQDKVITNIVQNSTEDSEIRVWVAGCSTGEEAYSIAILFCEVIESLKVKRNVRIFATDLDSNAISIASKGTFEYNISACVSAERLARFFTRTGNSFIINRDIRKMLIFSPHNVVQDPPFARLDLISCRNMIIYFEPVLQKDLFSIFHAALKNGGYLFLGKSEAVGSYTEVFPVVDAPAKIFTHRCNIKIKGAKPVPYLQNMIDDVMNSETNDIIMSKTQMRSIATQAEISVSLLERFMPACIVVDEKNELAYTYGDCKKYIFFPVGKVTHALFDIISEPLQIPVSTALKEARVSQKLVQYTGILIPGQVSAINLTAAPVTTVTSGPDSLYALIFTEINSNETLPEAVPYEIDHMAAQRITDLEQELVSIHDNLKKSISEQEIANEELQASNEELLTANEELQSSNEELQSVNEELYTVNSEYQTKLAELADMNDDITNFLSTTLIGMIFVDSNLCIRRFTNYVTTEFNILDQDMGRPIDFISYQFSNLNISTVCMNVINTLTADEREVDTNRNKTFFMRTAPFRTAENKILGCVITFVDLTTQKQERSKLQATEAQLSIAQRNNAAKNDFLSRISHEIRTPLNALNGLSELIKTQLDDKDALRSSAAQISGTVKYMTAIIADILEISKIERSQVDLISVPFSIHDVVNRIVTLIKPLMNEAGLNFSTQVSDNFSPVYIGDAARIQQILINLLTNARKYTKRGGNVSFSISEQSIINGIATISFSVADTGIGISPGFIPDLFKPFTRETHGDKDYSSSMGLGLSIVQNLVKLMDGDIKVESKVGIGSTFTGYIKLLIADHDLHTPPEASDNLELKDFTGCTVLIAEDNELNLSVLTSLLSSKGVTCITAYDGTEALKSYLSAPDRSIDCILMDIRMPNMDGIEATIKIRESGRPDAEVIPIIAISADAMASEINLAREAGISDYITKPIDTIRLFTQLDRYWKKSFNKF